MRIGTIFEGSHVALHIWLQAMYLIAGSKKGISSNQLHRTLGVTLKTAWFMSHRIREAMANHSPMVFGSGGTPVEVDETYIGQKEGVEQARGGFRHKMRVVSLIDRATGEARSIDANKMVIGEIADIVFDNVARQAQLYTDEARHYWAIGAQFVAHETTVHARAVCPWRRAYQHH